MHQLPANYKVLTQTERREVRLQYVELQKGLCYHCKAPLQGDPTPEVRRLEIKWRLFPKGFQNYPVHLHHSHDTGMTIGAVHAFCNAVLWQYYGE